mmetsp:Transcript_9264/g.13681  ORF Transcript_9264/g.13681 Transcript_9264/m.13681 type:complete len:294 (-) Transcript_9264:317-1198(-)|eukprot:CAMPEP_0206481996 /NCGR_PEP_ID=MMETSP0324_2-20121206/38558_1 /ASSEMBLY_ACC=CAM_ASM_000836 /TAXON_ID=2866 /ORGANISM="Crypthecodinium cohnii, Strain Seligo" /LENGTH=293 /DNA_ID=CAMNT_0053959753 /DNA_START=41 /DNA_END=922 /DNA_ORIENTATION=+
MESKTLENPPWMPCYTAPVQPPPSQRQLEEDQKWRPARPRETQLADPSQRTWRAVEKQCQQSRVPGYTGFIPSAKAEDICGRTAAAVGDRSVYEQARREQMRSSSLSGPGRTGTAPGRAEGAGSARSGTSSTAFDAEHPLGRSQCYVQNHHWVPTIPGYTGYVPGKRAENLCGGGIIHTCKLAGRTIAARSSPGEIPPEEPAAGHWRSRNVAEGTESPEQVRLAAHIREHCARHIPGYSGHIPHVHGDNICGATFNARNLLAADMAKDKIYHPERHLSDHCAPQAPCPRKLRI